MSHTRAFFYLFSSTSYVYFSLYTSNISFLESGGGDKREGDKRSIVLVNLHLPSMAGQEAAAVQSEGAGLGDGVALRLVRLADPLK